MDKELVTRILIQLEPSLAQEFGLAIAEDEKKLKVLKIINEKNVDVGSLKVCVSAYAYNKYSELTKPELVTREKIIQEDYYLIKGVLLCD